MTDFQFMAELAVVFVGALLIGAVLASAYGRAHRGRL